MSPQRKRPAENSEGATESAKRRFVEAEAPSTSTQEEQAETTQVPLEASKASEDASASETAGAESSSATSKAQERMERFKALKARAKNSAEKNHKETAAESQRLATDPALLNTLNRKHAFASHNLLKADTEAAGEDFERKRAWDWTVEESERWDKRMEKKQRHRDNVTFQDYAQDARKTYKRQTSNMAVDLEAYEKKKMEAIERAAASGGLEIVETDDGELVAVDKDGTFYSTADSTDFAQNKPSREAVDRLVADMKKAEDVKLKRRLARGKGDDDGDVTYINDKNKHFNQKLARFYNKYTADIRDSFERGTAV